MGRAARLAAGARAFGGGRAASEAVRRRTRGWRLGSDASAAGAGAVVGREAARQQVAPGVRDTGGQAATRPRGASTLAACLLP
jgi:hypothetical protein